MKRSVFAAAGGDLAGDLGTQAAPRRLLRGIRWRRGYPGTLQRPAVRRTTSSISIVKGLLTLFQGQGVGPGCKDQAPAIVGIAAVVVDALEAGGADLLDERRQESQVERFEYFRRDEISETILNPHTGRTENGGLADAVVLQGQVAAAGVRHQVRDVRRPSASCPQNPTAGSSTKTGSARAQRETVRRRTPVALHRPDQTARRHPACPGHLRQAGGWRYRSRRGFEPDARAEPNGPCRVDAIR